MEYEFKDIVKRREWFSKAWTSFWKAFASTVYRLEFSGIEHLQELDGQGFVLLPKHQSWLDIPVEAVLLGKVDRRAFYVMKDTLPGILQYAGGITVTRTKDLKIKYGPDEVAYQHARSKAKERNGRVSECLYELLLQGEIIVDNPEGTRNFGTEGSIKSSALQKYLDMQEEHEVEIPFLPLNITYNNGTRPLSHVMLDVGAPICIDRYDAQGLDKLVMHLRENIPLMR